MNAQYSVATEWLTIAQAARELGMDYKRILKLTKREEDPLPARLIDGNKKQARIYRPFLNEWVLRNSEELQ